MIGLLSWHKDLKFILSQSHWQLLKKLYSKMNEKGIMKRSITLEKSGFTGGFSLNSVSVYSLFT